MYRTCTTRTFLAFFRRVSTLFGRCSRRWLGVGNDPRLYKDRVLSTRFLSPLHPKPSKPQSAILPKNSTRCANNVQAEHPGLTLTQIYNVLEKIRAGETLDDDDEAIKTNGLVLILKELHEKLDALVGASLWLARKSLR